MKVTALDEVKERIAKGYKGELMYNLRSGNYEITTWLVGAENLDTKTHKIARGIYNPNDLKDAVYGTSYSKKKA